MSTAENKELMRRFYGEVCDQQQFNLVDQLVAEDYEHHNASLPPEMQRGRANFKQVLMMFYGAFPDLKATVEDLIAEDDKVAARVRFRGTHQGDLMGIPASGHPVDFVVSETYRIADGRLAEGWAVIDIMGVMQQIGAVPSPERAPA